MICEGASMTMRRILVMAVYLLAAGSSGRVWAQPAAGNEAAKRRPTKNSRSFWRRRRKTRPKPTGGRCASRLPRPVIITHITASGGTNSAR